jgi:hypothetical protein
MQGLSQPAEKILALQARLCCMQLVGCSAYVFGMILKNSH